MIKERIVYYDGSQWYDGWQGPMIHSEKERNTWTTVIIKEGVEVIPYRTFYGCKNLRKVIMPNSVKRIGAWAFAYCTRLMHIKWSENIELIENLAFYYCMSLQQVTIPSKCKDIRDSVFEECHDLTSFVVEKSTLLGDGIIKNTNLMRLSPFDTNEDQSALKEWIKHRHDKCSLHQLCTSNDPQICQISQHIEENGIESALKQDDIGLKPLDCLLINSNTSMDLINDYILHLLQHKKL